MLDISTASDGSRPTKAELKSALNNGITPIGTTDAGASYVVKRITTRCQDGAVANYLIRDSHKVFVADKFSDECKLLAAQRFAGKNVANDPDPRVPATNTNAVSPRDLRALLVEMLQLYTSRGLLEDLSGSIASIKVWRNTDSNNLESEVSLNIINVLDQTGMTMNQVG